MESLAYEKKGDDQLSKRRATTRPLDHDDLLTSQCRRIRESSGAGGRLCHVLTLSQLEGEGG